MLTDRAPVSAIFAAMIAAMLTGSSHAAEHRGAVLYWRGVDTFDSAKIVNSMSAAVRRPGKVAGVTMPAIFLHPQNERRSVAEFPEPKVAVGGPSRVFFVGYAGISDGMPWDEAEHPADGARFYVTVDGKEVAQAYVRENRWAPLVAPFWETKAAPGGAAHSSLSLATDCGPEANSNYDWALFGDPMLVAVPYAPLPAGTAVAGVNGVLVAEVTAGAGTLIVEGLAPNGAPVAGAEATAAVADGTKRSFVQFDFSGNTQCTQWWWRAAGVKVSAAYGGSWQPRLTLEHCGPARAVRVAGEALHVRVAVRNAGLGTLLPDAGAYAECNGKRLLIGRIAPDETKAMEFVLEKQRSAGTVRVDARAGLAGAARALGEATTEVAVLPKLPTLPAGRPQAAEVRKVGADFVLLQNASCRWVVCTKASGLAALVYVWIEGKWEGAGSVAPWAEAVLPDGTSWLPDFVVTGADERAAQFTASGAAGWSCQLSLEIGQHLPALRVEQRLESTKPLELLALRGPAVCAGDRFSGVEKGVASFPGLEYLDGAERSSSERDLAPPLNKRMVPHKFKVTVPMMLVETREGGPVVGVAWDPTQKWDGTNAAPAASFASPNFLSHQNNHLMQLLLPSVPDSLPENQREADKPLPVEPGKPWRLTEYVLAGKPEPDATGAFDWYGKLIGFPDAEKWPRTFDDEMALCRHAFLQTVWDEETKKSLHYVGSGKANAPGFATLMLMDARATAPGEDRQRLLDRVRLIADQTMKAEGAPGLTSGAACHIMGWEFPYHWGDVPGALAGMKAAAYASLNSQEGDGGWGYYPDKERERLGRSGERVVGISARNVYLLANWVAISGDPVAEAALRKGLAHMERYRVPRGAQGWECPILEPDVLASAYAVRAYVWAHMALGEARWLDNARFWARTGLPFQYTWDDGQHPGMRYASIPVFGSTFFTHTWIGLPVQWCGLVYAYGLVELSRFDNNDLWRKQIEGITASATHQQWPLDNKELAGTYPDSYGQWFTHRNGVYINPEDIVVNALALRGHDPGLRSVPLSLKDGLVHVTAPAEVQAQVSGKGLEAELAYVPNETCFVTVAPVAVTEGTSVRAADQVLARRDALGPGATGWAYDAQLKVLTVGLRADAKGHARLTIEGIRRSVPEAPQEQTAWEFERDAEGWTGEHSCALKAEAGHLAIQVTGDDPYAVSGPSSIPAGRFKKLRARVRLTGGNELGLFWRSSVSPGWGPDKEVQVAALGDGQWREVVFDLSKHPLWAGSIRQIRLDPEPAEVSVGAALEVDWIRPE
ncbi:MAG: hypothetical protein COZ06_27765 [Armatimonadetes bacterium CG_4_10_14_3_um_filter_66_18]|nr:MAG: hypothetical protein COS65_08765 [Armatimonadetes bacterium CG06_land_8_20_14_3_00_66_21]PIW20831.1 MAG: hypothetical protein COW34_00935 [Armatimonadetes bacterium CG17_big_fil_post_rev_8_21_14_2_50_66_6]PIX40700.1 MAG: hypothetical protein COZ57_25235 [Armatimonadetes bacterium CG_4_8_14_3_um_filter_66_20]PIY40715.1 MAG: hypothetical protein COZ06_27765 [Armatimonadetes bacterium CG_4_10_14_3_um_filter_66_18]PIZ41974.1 MAG: hypothetical protein COY42_18345 [Armatimonadetes bacterium C